MAQQTAVEWLVEQINMDNVGKAIIITFHNEFEQAKQMEKEQILDAIICNQNGLLRRKDILDAEKYYNETYNK
jgi:hypothetical protein